MRVEEQNIIKGLIEGQEGIYVLLYQKYYVSLCAYAHKYVGRKDVAEEIVSDVFFNLWKNRKNVHIRTSLKAYLFQATCNNSLYYLRNLEKEKKLEEYFSDAATNNIEFSFTPDEMSENSFTKEELFQHIENAVGQLPEQQQTAFKLKRYDGKKTKEIAEIMGLSVKTVEMHLSKAMLNLREKLKSTVPSFLFFLLLKRV